jgi:acetyl esterase/lipase
MTQIKQICTDVIAGLTRNLFTVFRGFRVKHGMTILLLFLLPLFLFAQTPQKETRIFAGKDGQELKMDIYTISTDCTIERPALIFAFGGGFMTGSRDNAQYIDYFNYFAERGFVVISIDYRLGMKGQRAPSPLNNRPLRNAIAMGVADLFSATDYILQNADAWNIDTERIIISGSSAGAIIVLQGDYELNNFKPSAAVLPDGFRFAGVISFAGAIFSTEGVPSYARRPAPTLFFHGSADRLVPYNNVRFFRMGMFGSRSLTNRFHERGFPYKFISKTGIGHEVAEYPMREFLPEIEQFINDFVINRSQLQIDIQIRDRFRGSDTSTTPASFFN